MAASDESRLVVRLEASVTQLTKELSKARQHTEAEMGAMVRATDRGLSQIERRRPPRLGLADSVRRETQEATASLGTLRSRLEAGASSFTMIGTRAAGAVGALLSVDKLRRYADTWQETANKIAAAGEATENVGARQSELATLAIRSRSEFSSVVDLYTGLRRATAELGASQAQVLQVTETVSKGFVVGGQSAATAAGAIVQLNQAFQSGKLSGDELNSVLEGAPPIARLIAKEFGVGVGELKKLAEEGKLTSDKVFSAILKGAADIEAEFAKTSATVGQSFTNLSTAFTRFVGELDQATGASGTFAKGIQGIADNINIVAPAAAVLAATLLGAFAGGPIVAGISGAATALTLFGDSIRPISSDIATLGDYGRAAFGIIREAATEMGPQLASAFQNAADLATQALSKIGDGEALPLLLDGVKAALNATIGAFVAAVMAIRNTWASLGPVLAENIVAAMNAVISTVQAAVNKVVGAVNSITGAVNAGGAKVGIEVGLGKIPEVNLGQVANRYEGAGKAAGEAYGKAFDALSLDYVGSAIDAGRKGLDELRTRANRAAAERLFSTPTRTALDNGSLDAKLKAKPGDKDGKGKGGGSDSENEFEREAKNIERRARAFDSERESVGRSAQEAAKAEAAFRLLEAAKRANIPVTDELRGRIDVLAGSYAAAKIQLDEAERAQRAAVESQRFLGAAMTDAVGDLVLEGRSASEVFEHLAKSIAKAALQAALMGSGPFGSGTGQGGAGGLIGTLFSAAASAFSGGIGGTGGSPTGGVRLFAEGYIAKGPGTGRSDSIPAMISNGEAVIPERVVSRHRPLVEALVRDRLPRFADGRMPDPAAFSAALSASVANLSAAPAARSTQAAQSVAQASRGERAPTPLTFSPTYTIDARGADPGIEARLRAMLDARDKALPQTIRDLQRRAG